LFRYSDKGDPLYLLLHHDLGHWDFPKGEIEKGESSEDTVRREIQEETGITNVEIVPGFKETIHYFYTLNGERFSKWVAFLLAKTGEEKVTLSFEHQGFVWLPFSEALDRFEFKASKNILRKADEYIKLVSSRGNYEGKS
jgi:bis(5'-nucleosidyl)-tetraphosphatase